LNLQAFRGEILHFLADPATVSSGQSYQYFADGLLVIQAGKVIDCGDYEVLKAVYCHSESESKSDSDIDVVHYQHGLIMPGFIDCHVHYPQVDMLAAYGEQLLQWLEQYTYPQERKFSDKDYASEVAKYFLQQLVKAGTTTALVFGTVHPQSVDAFFEQAEQHNLRMICGKVLMDQNCPDDLQDTPQLGYQQSKELIERWHGKGRLQYAVTPRFAPTCSQQQLNLAGKLLAQYPGVYIHTHLCENKKEIDWVAELFPQRSSYLDVYDHAKLVGKRSVFAHGVHLTDDDCKKLGDNQAALAFCPSSNLFLGSGLFNLKQAQQHKVAVGIGSDVGAGTSLSIMRNLNQAYKIQQLRNDKLDAFQALYLATLGGAKALDLDHTIGNFTAGKEADFVVLDYQGCEAMARRISHCDTLAEKLFVLTMLADERHIKATHIMGKKINIE